MTSEKKKLQRPNRPLRIAMIGNYGVTNIGDEAIREGLCVTLKKAFGECEITVMGRGNLLPVGFRSFLRALFRPEYWKKPLSILYGSDLVVLGGGGLLSDEEGPFVSTFWILHGLAALLLLKPVAVLGVSIGPLGFINKRLLKLLLKKAELVLVRDFASQKRLERMQISSKLGPDFALFFPYEKTEELPTEKPYIAISFRPYKNNSESTYKKIAQLCDYAIAEYGLNIRLIPLQEMVQNDTYVLSKIYEHIENKSHVEKLPFSDDIHRALEVISGAELVVGMRLHAGIFSIITRTSFMPIVYMKKVVDFWEDFEGNTPINLERLSVDELIHRFDKAWNNRREMRPLIHGYREKLVSKTDELIQLMSELFY